MCLEKFGQRPPSKFANTVIATFDKAYIKYGFLMDLTARGVFWVARAKDNMKYELVAARPLAGGGKIVSDKIIRLAGEKSPGQYPAELRLVEGWVEIDGVDRLMSFITNNFEWAASSICALYKSRWGIEVFFKEMKQTLQLADFIGHNENAVRWQIWTALLTYVLLRYCAYRSKWTHSFPRMFTVLRAILWHNFNLLEQLQRYGTAPDPPRIRAAPEQAYLPGFTHRFYGTA